MTTYIIMYCYVQELVLEKDTRIRELLLITGLKQWVLWMAWYIKQLVFLLFIALVMSIMIKVHVHLDLLIVAMKLYSHISSFPY